MNRERKHVEKALELLPEQFKGRPVLAALLSAPVRQVQVLEDATWDVLAYRANPRGWWLDQVGAIVGRGRNDLGDDDYWRAIQAQILANKSSGRRSTILDIVTLASPEGVTWTWKDAFPAGFRLQADAATYSVHVIRDLVRTAKGAGIRAHLSISTTSNDNVFQLAPGSVRVASLTKGLGSLQVPGSGGHLNYTILAE